MPSSKELVVNPHPHSESIKKPYFLENSAVLWCWNIIQNKTNHKSVDKKELPS